MKDIKKSFFDVFSKFNMLQKKEQNMDKEKMQQFDQKLNEMKAQGAEPATFGELEDNGGVVDVSEMAKKVEIHCYFGMDSVSGDLISFFTAKNVKAAVRSFCNSLDPLPLSMIKDFVLVDGETREIVFDGKDYEDEWKDHQQYRLEQMINKFKGGRNA